MTDATGALVWDRVALPFGTTHSLAGTATNPQRFPGQVYDTETGFHYNAFRDYDPSIGRYVESDPIGLRGGWNTFSYVGSAPLRYIDPLGLAKCTYYIAEHTMICDSNDEENRVVSSSVTSGLKECENDPSCVNKKDVGPVPPDTYNVEPNTKPGREGWWALQSTSWIPNLSGFACQFLGARCGFNLHMGSYSEGCITFLVEDPHASRDFREISDLLASDVPDNSVTVKTHFDDPSSGWP